MQASLNSKSPDITSADLGMTSAAKTKAKPHTVNRTHMYIHVPHPYHKCQTITQHKSVIHCMPVPTTLHEVGDNGTLTHKSAREQLKCIPHTLADFQFRPDQRLQMARLPVSAAVTSHNPRTWTSRTNWSLSNADPLQKAGHVTGPPAR